MNKIRLVNKAAILLTAALIFCSMLANAAEPKKGVAFRFNPPDGLTFIETFKNTTKQTLQTVPKKPFTITVQSKITIKKTENGYRAVRVPVICKLGDGCEINSFNDAMKLHKHSIVLEYELDKDGICQNVIGVEKLADKVISELQKYAPPGTRINPNSDLVKLILIDDVLDEINRWNENFALLSGTFMNTDDVVKTTIPRDFAGINAKSDIMIKFAGMEKAGGKDCAKIQVNSSFEPNALNELIGEAAKMFLKAQRIPGGIELTHSSIADKSEFIIDPTTHMPQSISSKQSMKFIANAQGMTNISVLHEEWRQYSYDYTKK